MAIKKRRTKHLLRGYECGTKSAPGVARKNAAKRKGYRNFKRAS